MRARNFPIIAGLAGLTLAVGAGLWLGKDRSPQAARNLPAPAPQAAAGAGAAAQTSASGPVTPLRDDGEPAPPEVRPARPPRRALSDAEVLVRAGVLPAVEKAAPPVAVAPLAVAAPAASPAVSAPSAPVASTPVVAASPAPAANPLQSLQAAAWKNQANRLVNALRAGQGMDLDHAQVMDFLQGKDLFGWPESYRNWIGDELMIVLCHDLPERAFADLRTIQENAAAPAAMRDYSVQHIGELVTKAIAGAEGADYLWQTLGKNDPATLSTTLITLHLLSGDKPDLVSASRVAAAAQKLLSHPDLRTQITAKSILRK